MEMKTSLQAHPIRERERVILDGESCPVRSFYNGGKKKEKGKNKEREKERERAESNIQGEANELVIGKDLSRSEAEGGRRMGVGGIQGPRRERKSFTIAPSLFNSLTETYYYVYYVQPYCIYIVWSGRQKSPSFQFNKKKKQEGRTPFQSTGYASSSCRLNTTTTTNEENIFETLVASSPIPFPPSPRSLV